MTPFPHSAYQRGRPYKRMGSTHALKMRAQEQGPSPPESTGCVTCANFLQEAVRSKVMKCLSSVFEASMVRLILVKKARRWR